MFPFEPVKKNALAEEISARLISLIKDRQLRPGEKLPPERELASMMEVSRPSLREALRALSMMNIIEIRQGDGTYVTSLDPDLLTEHLELVFSLDDSTILQLLEVRKIVEPEIAALAAGRINPEQVQGLCDLVERSSTADIDPPEFLAIDLELHERIAEAAANPLLKRIMASLGQLGMASRSRTVAIPGVRERSAEDHRAIVAALAAGDPETARKAMLAHLTHVEAGVAGIRSDQL